MFILTSTAQFLRNEGSFKEQKGLFFRFVFFGLDIESPQMNTSLAFKPFSGFQRFRDMDLILCPYQTSRHLISKLLPCIQSSYLSNTGRKNKFVHVYCYFQQNYHDNRLLSFIDLLYYNEMEFEWLATSSNTLKVCLAKLNCYQTISPL